MPDDLDASRTYRETWPAIATEGAVMDRERRALPILALLSGLAWLAAVLLISANHKGIDLAGDLAYDRANRFHTVALALMLATMLLVHRVVRGDGLAGGRTAKLLVIAAALMLVGNVVSFWGALATDGPSDAFWGGWAGWLTYLPGSLLMLGALIVLARAARAWPNTSGMQRWAIGATGVLLSITSITWAISPAVTLAPAVLAAFGLLTMGTTVAHASATVPADRRATAAV
jgi:hypothetical protein